MAAARVAPHAGPGGLGGGSPGQQDPTVVVDGVAGEGEVQRCVCVVGDRLRPGGHRSARPVQDDHVLGRVTIPILYVIVEITSTACRTCAEAGLTIGAVAARTGLSVPVLRSWEQRHGFPGRRGSRAATAATTTRTWPDPARRRGAPCGPVPGGGHRAGPAQPRGGRRLGGADGTVYAGLRRRRPDLDVARAQPSDDAGPLARDRGRVPRASRPADGHRRLQRGRPTSERSPAGELAPRGEHPGVRRLLAGPIAARGR